MTITFHDWTVIPGLSQRLIELHALTGARMLSMGQIAEKLNAEFHTEITRNAVIGRCRRIGLTGRIPGTPRSKKVRAPKRVASKPDAPIAPIRLRQVASPDAVKRRRNESLSIYQLREDDCHWPLGAVDDYPPFQYCGKPSLFGRPYCPVHHKRAHNNAGSH